MSNSFAELKKKKAEASSNLAAAFSKVTAPKFSNDDEKFWYPDVDKAGNGFAVVRFLPAPVGEDVPFIRMYSYQFKGPTGKWYIENSLRTLGQDDPVGEMNSKYWNSGVESDKDIARKHGQKTTFTSNVLIVRYPADPSMEGKVVLYRYGKKIFDKLQAAMSPKFEDEAPMNPFDLDDGADFKIKIAQEKGYRNYDASEFAAPTKCGKNDEEQEVIWKQCQSLTAFHAPSNFKSYDELKRKLLSVLGEGAPSVKSAPKETEAAAPKATKVTAAKAPDEEEDEDDESAKFFKELEDKV